MTGRIALLVFLTWLLTIAGTAQAIDVGPPVASDQDIATWLGRVQYSMIICSPSQRAARIEVERYSSWGGGFFYAWLSPNLYRSSIREVTRRAIPFMFEKCPQSPKSNAKSVADVAEWARSKSVPEWVSIVSDEKIQYEAHILVFSYNDELKKSINHWFVLHEYTGRNWWHWVWRWCLILMPVVGLVWALRYWETFARWYFFYFYPHPARHMVRGALNTGSVLDGPALAKILGELPPGSSTFRKVRLEQGEALVEQMQAMSRSIAAAQARAAARQYERQAAEGYEQAAVHAIQEAIALAAVALERAKAAWQTSEAIRKRGRA